MSISEKNIINIDDNTLLPNTPMIEVTQGGETLHIPIMSYSKEPDYYMCSSVEGTTWTGEKLIKDSVTDTYTRSGVLSSGLTITRYTPEIGGIYTDDTYYSTYGPVGTKLNNLYAAGYNNSVHLGIGTTSKDNVLEYTKVKPDNRTFKFVSSYLQTIAIDSSGFMWVVGSNGKGQLGLGSTTSKTAFTKCGSNRWKYASTGANFSMAVDESGKLWTCGTNSNYKLGTGDTSTASYATEWTDTGLTNIISADSSNTHVAAVDTEGRLYSWGINTNGELCTGDTTSVATASQVTGLAINGVTPKWASVHCGGNFTILMDDTGKLYSCGLNSSGQLGINSTTNSITLCEVGSTDADKNRRYKYVDTGETHVVAIDMDDNLWAWGANYAGLSGAKKVPTKVTAFNKCKTAQAGWQHTLAIDMDGNMWAAGRNDYGQCGTGSTSTSSSVFTKIGTDKWQDIGKLARYSSFAWKA